MPFVHPADAVKSHRAAFEAALTDALKTLLETKHLYQSVRITEPDPDVTKATVADDFRQNVDNGIKHVLEQQWSVVDPFQGQGASDKAVNVRVPDLKLYCRICKRVEPFNFLSAHDFLTRLRRDGASPFVRVLVMSFVCQSCKGAPEVFMVRSANALLTLCGRAPMEAAQVPSFVPKSVQSR